MLSFSLDRLRDVSFSHSFLVRTPNVALPIRNPATEYSANMYISNEIGLEARRTKSWAIGCGVRVISVQYMSWTDP